MCLVIHFDHKTLLNPQPSIKRQVIKQSPDARLESLQSLEQPGPGPALRQQQGKDALARGTKEEQERLSSLRSWQQMPPTIHTETADCTATWRDKQQPRAYRDMARSPRRNSSASLLSLLHSMEERSPTALAGSGPEPKTKQLHPHRSPPPE